MFQLLEKDKCNTPQRLVTFKIPMENQFQEQTEIEINLVNIYSVTITCQALLGMVKKIMGKTQFLLSRILCTNVWDTSYKYITYNKLNAKGGVRTECKENR